jgi:3-dehydroquinate synthase
MTMTRIERNIQVNYRQQVHFVDGAFSPENMLLRDVLADGSQHRRHKVLVVVDEALAKGQPDLLRRIEIYFAAFARELNLVCPPLVMEGGERTKNSYFHVSEVHSQIDRFHIDRHSYVICIGGGRCSIWLGSRRRRRIAGCGMFAFPRRR